MGCFPFSHGRCRCIFHEHWLSAWTREASTPELALRLVWNLGYGATLSRVCVSGRFVPPQSMGHCKGFYLADCSDGFPCDSRASHVGSCNRTASVLAQVQA